VDRQRPVLAAQCGRRHPAAAWRARKDTAKDAPENGLVRYWMAQGMPEHVARRYVAELKERAPKKPPGGKKRGR
jgi:hypothetical protein